MNVRLAAQVLSSGVADAIDYLRISGDTNFVDSEATTEFIRVFDQLFDVMNSRSSYAKGFKSPIFNHNVEYLTNFFVNAKYYISSLTINGKNILVHPRKNFAIGFIANTLSILDLSVILLTKGNPLKIFSNVQVLVGPFGTVFSCVRSRGGWNDNPNCLQFMWALRKLLVRNTVTPSINANCMIHTTASPTILEFRTAKRTVVEPNINSDDEHKKIFELISRMDRIELSSFQ